MLRTVIGASRNVVFSSVTFLFYYLPVVLLAFHLLFLPVSLGWRPQLWRRASNALLLLVSLLFYFWGETFLVWIVVASTAVDFLCGLTIARGWSGGSVQTVEEGGHRSPTQRAALVVSIVSNLAFLGFFKYANFFVGSFTGTLTAIGLNTQHWAGLPEIALPLGISFYTFQSMSYTIDVYRGRVRATRNLIDFACYVTMFPQLVAGPIVRYRDVAEQLLSRTVGWELFASGVRRFVFGLAKKVLVANTVAVAADAVFAIPGDELTPAAAWLGIICYTLQIYFDFSGYSDMAIGLGRMLGFRYLENFNYPYIAQSIQEFWRRWHISLSTWFRDYLYIPLGGSRGSTLRTYSNLFTVFFLCGLWHGAAWNFVVWGLFHGSFLVIERVGLADVLDRAPRPFRHGYTVIVAMVGWVFFRAETLGHAVDYLAAMTGLSSGDPVRHALGAYISPELLMMIVVGTVGAAPLVPAVSRWLHGFGEAADDTIRRALAHAAWPTVSTAAVAVLMVAVAMRLASGSHNPFIYFRF